jgi:hypothetical protein
MLYSFFWVIARCLNFMCRRFGTHCSIFIGGVDKKNNLDEIGRVFTQVKVWLKISVGQSERGGTGTYVTLTIRLPFHIFPLTLVFKLSSGNVI